MSDVRARLALLTSGLRWRLGSSLAMLVIAIAAVATGAFGPMYLHSANQSVLNATLDSAPPGNRGLTLEPARGSGSPLLLRAADRVPRADGGTKWFGKGITTDEVGFSTVAGNETYTAGLMARSGACAHLVLVAGSCSTQAGTVVMSARSAHELGLAVGRKVDLSFTGSSSTASLTLTGLYAPNPSNPYWWGINYFGFGTGAPGKPILDEAFASFRTIGAVAPAPLVDKMVQLPFRAGSLAAGTTSDFESLLTQYKNTALADDGVIVSTGLPQILADAAAQEHTATSIVLVVDLELVLLTVFALYFIASRTAAERLPDVQLSVLRGYGLASTLFVALIEPVVIVLAAVPAGLLIAWVVASASASGLFGPDIGASITPLALGGALLAGVIGIVAVALASRRTLGTAEAAVESEDQARRHSTWRIAGDIAVIAVAGAAFLELAVAGVSGSPGTRANPLSAFAPALLALTFGIIAARLLPVLLRTAWRLTGHPRSMAWILATRRVARRPEFASEILLVAMCSALAVFAISGWAVNARNHTVQDGFAVGAAKVLTVSVRPGVNFLGAVREADRSGHSAMAAVVENAGDGTTLAVDSRDMGQVVSWPSALGAGGPTQVARRLVPAGLAPPVEISGSQLRIHLDSTVAAQPAPQLSVDLFDQGFQAPQQIVLGNLVSGSANYAASIAGLCPETCLLTDVALTWAPASSATVQSGTADIDISSMSELRGGRWDPVAAGLDRPGLWTSPTGGAHLTDRPASSSSGLAAAFTLNPDAAPVAIAPADVPRALPTVLTTTAATVNPPSDGPLLIAGLDGGMVAAHAIGQIAALPRVGDDADIVDLGMAQRSLSGPFVNDTTEVWLSASAPSDIDSRLAADGISVVRTDSVTARQAASAHSAVNLAYALFLIAGLAAAALAVVAAAFALAAGARGRNAELAALRAIGIPAASLRRSSEAEQALALGTGLLFGAGAGLAAAAVALRSVPEFVSLGPGPPLELTLPAALLAVGLVAVAALLWMVVRLGSSLLVRGASIEKLGSTRS